MSHVLVGAQTIALNLQSISRDLAGTAPEDLRLILAQAATSADSITEIFEPYNPGLSVPDGLHVKAIISAFYALEIRWSPVENATGYLIQRSENSTGPWTDFDAPSLLTHVLYDPVSEDLYEFFRVRAYRDFGSTRWYSAWSDPVGGTENSDEIPSNFSATSTSTSITVKWDPIYTATGYQVHVYQLLEGSTHYYTLVTETTKTVNDLSPETDYYVDVRYYRTYPGSTNETEWGTPTSPLYIKTKAP
ncbi:hypothetical protein SDC9_166829 [bioreactor metagenome]|uniref:Fibronectin type-III domain-containing protein n=1 Tax=bioreactor metagenome TaxID=1076179 RepID=A0A645G0N5_9ZZZZ